MNLLHDFAAERSRYLSRRWFFRDCALGLGSIALGSLLGGQSAAAAANPLAPRPPHFKPKAKRVIYLFQAGAPSQLDMFDYKPALEKWNGKPVPPEVVKGQQYAFIKPDAALYASEFKFAKHGKSGAELSDAIPNLAGVVDDIVIIKSMATDAFNHAPGQIFMNTGSQQFGRPSMGAWVTYGLGSESQDLPAYVVLNSAGGLSGGSGNFGCGFLPTVFQGVPFRKGADPILHLSNPAGISDKLQRRTLDAIKELNEHRLGHVGDPRDRHAHQFVRDGLPDADKRAGTHGPFQGVEGDARDVWRGTGQGFIRQQLPARPATDRTRRAFRAALP